MMTSRKNEATRSLSGEAADAAAVAASTIHAAAMPLSNKKAAVQPLGNAAALPLLSAAALPLVNAAAQPLVNSAAMPLDKKRKAATPLIKRPCRAASGNAAAKGEAVCARARVFFCRTIASAQVFASALQLPYSSVAKLAPKLRSAIHPMSWSPAACTRTLRHSLGKRGDARFDLFHETFQRVGIVRQRL